MARVRRYGQRSLGRVNSSQVGRRAYGRQPVCAVVRSSDTHINDFIEQLPENLRGNARGAFYGKSLPRSELCDVLVRELGVPLDRLFTAEVFVLVARRGGTR